jgi:hypothetical protein
MIYSGWDGARSSTDRSATCICAAHSQILCCITPIGTQFLRSDGHGLGPTACGKPAASFLWHRCSTVCLAASPFPVGEADRTAVASDPASAPFLDFPMPPSDASYQNFFSSQSEIFSEAFQARAAPGGLCTPTPFWARYGSWHSQSELVARLQSAGPHATEIFV